MCWISAGWIHETKLLRSGSLKRQVLAYRILNFNIRGSCSVAVLVSTIIQKSENFSFFLPTAKTTTKIGITAKAVKK